MLLLMLFFMIASLIVCHEGKKRLFVIESACVRVRGCVCECANVRVSVRKRGAMRCDGKTKKKIGLFGSNEKNVKSRPRVPL